MTSKVASGDSLPDDVFRSQKSADPRVIRSLAGRTRIRYERATGRNPVLGEPPASGLNPQGIVGHDHSGPPWGAAILHPVAWLVGIAPNSADIQSGYFAARDAIVDDSARALGPWVIWQRPHAPLPSPAIAPYSRLYLYVRAFTDAGTSDLTVALRSRQLFSAQSISRTSTMGTVSTTEGALFKEDAYVDMVPGYNRIDLSLSGSHASNEITLVCAALCQIVKLTH